MKIHCLQHVAYEGPACIPEWAAANGYSCVTTRLDLKEAFPKLGEFDILIVLGGPMSVYREDRWPWMSGERRLIRRAIDGGKVVLGICLGAQLIAAELGGSVEANDETEIGWFDITLTADADHSIIGGVLAALWAINSGIDPVMVVFPISLASLVLVAVMERVTLPA